MESFIAIYLLAGLLNLIAFGLLLWKLFQISANTRIAARLLYTQNRLLESLNQILARQFGISPDDLAGHHTEES